MISTFLATYPWMANAALVAVIVVAPLIGLLVVRHRPVGWALFALSLVAVIAVTLYPESRTPDPGCRIDWQRLPTGPEGKANLILFIPPVLLAAVLTRRSGIALVAGCLASAAIELLQAAVPAIGRSCDGGDWIANTAGAVVGALLGFAVIRLASWRTRRDTAPG